MKRLLFSILCILLLCGCQQKEKITEKVKTVIEQTDHQKVAMNYPITAYDTLNEVIQKDVDQDYQKFKKKMKDEKIDSEFNLSYTYEVLHQKYLIITLTTMLNSNTLAHPIYQIHTYVFDQDEEKLLKLSDFITQQELEKILPMIKDTLLKKYKDCILMEEFSVLMTPDFQNFPFFTLNDDYLILYYNPYQLTAGYCQILKIELPLDKIGLNIEFERGVFEEKSHEKISVPDKIIDPNQKVIALTFDDGPSYYTDRILDYLKEQKVTATFFLIGNKINRYEETVKKMVRNGNEIGNHSYSHKWLTKLSKQELDEEIQLTQDYIKKLTGLTPKIFRPTYGATNQKLQKDVGMPSIMWTVDSSDWKIKNAKTIANRVFNSSKDSSIILMHDTHERSYESLKFLIPKLKEDGYQFVTVSELETVKKLRTKAQKNAAES